MLSIITDGHFGNIGSSNADDARLEAPIRHKADLAGERMSSLGLYDVTAEEPDDFYYAGSVSGSRPNRY